MSYDNGGQRYRRFRAISSNVRDHLALTLIAQEALFVTVKYPLKVIFKAFSCAFPGVTGVKQSN